MRLIAAALATALAIPASAGVDLAAHRLTLDRSSGTYSATDTVTMTMTYEATGDASSFSGARMEVEIRTNPPTRIAFAMQAIRVPSGLREFIVDVNLGDRRIPEGTWTVVATIDSSNLIGETNESNNTARTTLTVGRPAAATAPPSQPSGGWSQGANRRVVPRAARTVSQTTCSALERSWRSPVEVGWHPGFGQATAVLEFDHPLTAARAGERIGRSRLVLSVEETGRPFSTLGPLQVTMRPLGSRTARCPSGGEIRATESTLDGPISIDLARVVRDAQALPWECAERLQVTLSFPEARDQPDMASLVQVNEQLSGVDVEITR